MIDNDYRCPVCLNTLSHNRTVRDGKEVITMYCSIGRCPSTAANDGGEGHTMEEAYNALEKRINEEGL